MTLSDRIRAFADEIEKRDGRPDGVMFVASGDFDLEIGCNVRPEQSYVDCVRLLLRACENALEGHETGYIQADTLARPDDHQ